MVSPLGKIHQLVRNLILRPVAPRRVNLLVLGKAARKVGWAVFGESSLVEVPRTLVPFLPISAVEKTVPSASRTPLWQVTYSPDEQLALVRRSGGGNKGRAIGRIAQMVRGEAILLLAVCQGGWKGQ